MTRLFCFTAEWCAPCRKFGPSLTKEAEDLGLIVNRLDIDAAPEAAHAMSVMSVPTVIAVRAGQIVDRFGYLGPVALRERLSSLMET